MYDCVSVFVCVRMLVDNVSNKLTQSIGRQEFIVPSNVLGLVYGQTIVWTGALYCPLLPLINTLKFIILFYIKKVTASGTYILETLVYQFSCWVLIPTSPLPIFFYRSHSSKIIGQR